MTSGLFKTLVLASLVHGVAYGNPDPAKLRVISPQDNPAKLLTPSSDLILNLKEIHTQGLVSGEVAVQPWSDDYWPTYRGQTAYRYADESFRAANFADLFALFNANDSLNIFAKLSGETPAREAAINRLSPAEKYDLLMGDTEFSLTHSQWASGQKYQQSKGMVEEWMGLCHGWAIASYMLPRPRQSVVLKSPDQKTSIKFFPSDIKALSTLLWAQAAPASRFVGDRCREKEPARDAVGRNRDEKCFNTNPATFHAALATVVGAQRRSFVMDVTYDYEVWNQPVRDYRITYFNLDTGAESSRFSDVALRWKDYRGNDPYRSTRGGAFSNPAYIVGAKVRVRYMIENTPSTEDADEEDNDEMTEVTYEYDLELDRDFNITGGEWHSAEHPDFLWTLDPGTHALTRIERSGSISGEFTGDAAPADWTAHAKSAAASQSAPLGKVVEELVRRSDR